MLSRAATTPTLVSDSESRGREMEKGRRVDILVVGGVVAVAVELGMMGSSGNSIIDVNELESEW